ncbi:MAG: hypothetical protein SFV15_05095 [Polyangiaceae bacterium]|nr:hypothetical protein [Polyangiaceae bacterium]
MRGVLPWMLLVAGVMLVSSRAHARGVDANAYGFAEVPKAATPAPLRSLIRVRSGIGLLYTNADYDISFMHSPTSYTVAKYAQPRTGLAYTLDLTLGLGLDRRGLAWLGASYRGHWRPSVPDVSVERAIGLHSRFTLVQEALVISELNIPKIQWTVGPKLGVGLLREYLGPYRVTASNTAYVLGASLAKKFPLRGPWHASIALDATVHNLNPYVLLGSRLVEAGTVRLLFGIERRSAQ